MTAAKCLQSQSVASCSFSRGGEGDHTVLSSLFQRFYVQREIICALSNVCPVKGNNLFSRQEGRIRGRGGMQNGLNHLG